MEDLSRPSQIAAATPPISGIQQQPIPLELARTPSRRMIPAGVQEMSRYPAADPLPNIAIGLSSVAAGADNSAATVGCCAGKVFGA